MSDQAFFDLMFVTVLGWQFHPRNPPVNRMSVDECLDVCAEALDARRRFQECHGWLSGEL